MKGIEWILDLNVVLETVLRGTGRIQKAEEKYI